MLLTDLRKVADDMLLLAVDLQHAEDLRAQGMGDGLAVAAAEIRRFANTVEIDLTELEESWLVATR